MNKLTYEDEAKRTYANIQFFSYVLGEKQIIVPNIYTHGVHDNRE